LFAMSGPEGVRTPDLMTASSSRIRARSWFQRVKVRKTAQNSARKLKFRTLGAPKKMVANLTRRAKKEGKTLGRPRVIVDREKVRQLHGQGNSVRIIAAQLGLTKSTVHSIVTG